MTYEEYLLQSARFGDEEEVKMCIEEQTDLNCKNEQLNTPLHMASANGHLSIIKLLLTAGAVVNAVNDSGSTALHWAAGNAHL